MKHGPAWIILEESPNQDTKLVSILPPRRTSYDVARYMRQLYVDRSTSVKEKLIFKKNQRKYPLEVLRGVHPNPMSVGHNPFLLAVYADNTSLKGNRLSFEYMIHINPKESPMNARFERREQTITVEHSA